mgnify:FL=1
MINKIAVALTAMILLIFSVLLWISFHYYGKTVTQRDSITTLTQQKNEAEFITQTQALTVGIFNTIAQSTLDKQHAKTLDAQAAQTDIKAAISGDACSAVVVPARAADRLLAAYNAVRKGSGNANAGKSPSTVSRIGSTR